MGQKISTSSLSCVDCGSRLITLEDHESSSKFKTREFFFQECSDDMNDEVTVFESPLRQSKTHSQSQTLEKSSVLDSSSDVLTIPGSNLGESDCKKSPKRLALQLRAIKTSSSKMHEEYLLSETSTPSCVNNSSIFSGRCKTFSSNFSPVSVNLVDSIRKTSNSTCNIKKNSN